MSRIEPVPPRKVRQALTELVGGEEGARTRIAVFESLLTGPRGEGARLWWARGRGRTQGAALVMRHPGRCGMMLHSPPPAGRQGRRRLAELLSTAGQAALEEGLAFVQALIRPDDEAAGETLTRAGFDLLAELIYLQRRLRDLPDPPTRVELTACGEDLRPRLREAIRASYVGSRDCPALLGLRSVDEVLATHEDTGIFTPRSWWLARHEGQDIGCVLVNGNAGGSPGDSELVYFGLAPPWRGRRLGRSVLLEAMRRLEASGRDALHLAVDSANAPAVRLYEQLGFAERCRRVAYILTPRGQQDEGPADEPPP
jgi:GNAT superfamily N-acetyltransferase